MAHILWLSFLLVVLYKDEVWSAEKIAQPFKNVDQVIGWLKAKGQCKTDPLVELALTKCSAVISLPSKDPDNRKVYSPGWTLLGEIHYLEDKFAKRVTVFVSRVKRIRLSDKDANAVINIQKTTGYQFNSQGILTQSTVKVIMTNFRGESILNLDFPVLPRCIDLGDDGVEDVGFLRVGFRFHWDWMRDVDICQ